MLGAAELWATGAVIVILELGYLLWFSGRSKRLDSGRSTRLVEDARRLALRTRL